MCWTFTTLSASGSLSQNWNINFSCFGFNVDSPCDVVPVLQIRCRNVISSSGKRRGHAASSHWPFNSRRIGSLPVPVALQMLCPCSLTIPIVRSVRRRFSDIRFAETDRTSAWSPDQRRLDVAVFPSFFSDNWTLSLFYDHHVALNEWCKRWIRFTMLSSRNTDLY